MCRVSQHSASKITLLVSRRAIAHGCYHERPKTVGYRPAAQLTHVVLALSPFRCTIFIKLSDIPNGALVGKCDGNPSRTSRHFYHLDGLWHVPPRGFEMVATASFKRTTAATLTRTMAPRSTKPPSHSPQLKTLRSCSIRNRKSFAAPTMEAVGCGRSLQSCTCCRNCARLYWNKGSRSIESQLHSWTSKDRQAVC